MSVIVGVEATVKPYASVVAADTMYVDGRVMYDLSHRLVDGIKPGDKVTLEELGEGIPTGTYHKIFVSPSRNSVLAYVGTVGGLFEDVKGFLFGGPEYLGQANWYNGYSQFGGIDIVTDFAYHRDGLLQVNSGNALKPETIEVLWQEYVSSFSLEERLIAGYIPEIPRIAAVRGRSRLISYKTNADDPSFNRPPFDTENCYLFSTTVKAILNRVGVDLHHEEPTFEDKIQVFPIRSWGMAGRSRPFSAFGSGGAYAMEYLHKELGLDQSDSSYNFKVEDLDIDISRAAELARGAVEYANEKTPFCDGLDYVVLTADGVEEHFSEEEKSGTIDMRRGIKVTIAELESALEQFRTTDRLLDERANS